MADRRPAITPRAIAKEAARTADELKAHNIVILDVRKLCEITDFLVICTGDNRRQLRAIKNRASADFKHLGLHGPRAEGEDDNSWILLDLADVVIHIFDAEARDFYDLELLWGDAPKVKWERATAKR